MSKSHSKSLAKSLPKITLSASRDIPFDQLRLAQSNVRRIKAGVSIEELAEDIARRTLLTSLTVRPVLDEAGQETGLYEIPAGGRRFRALELLVKQKRLAKTAPIPCIVRTDGLAEEDSLAENVQRAALHPLDQFRAFQALRDKGMSEEEIAAAFFISASVVRQRLKLAAVSPKLLDIYAEDGMTLEQLMAFTVNPDPERQDQVWEALQHSYSKEAYTIRRMLTEGAVRASDKRARCVGLEAYVDAGGTILRDLFEADDGGWLQDAGLLNQLVARKLDDAADTLRMEGWRWVEMAPDFPYGYSYGLRRLSGSVPPLTPAQEAEREALASEYAALEAAYESADELPDDADRRLGEIETALETLDHRPATYEADDMARAGAFVSLEANGQLRVERGFVRPEDEAPVLDASAEDEDHPAGDVEDASKSDQPDDADVHDDEDIDDRRPLPDRLAAELSAHRTLALRDALSLSPGLAYLAALHALTLRLFYSYGLDSCLELTPKWITPAIQPPGLGETPCAQNIDRRHMVWASGLPERPEDLWDALQLLDPVDQHRLFAHCVALTVNAIAELYAKRPRALKHAHQLAQCLGLDMARAGWRPTADSYLARVTKAQICDAVREACGEDHAALIADLKKPDMVAAAEQLLEGTGWLPEPLRTVGQTCAVLTDDITGDDAMAHDHSVAVQSAEIGGEPAIDANADPEDDDSARYVPTTIAAE